MKAFFELTAEAMGVGEPRRVPLWAARMAAGRETIAALTRSARSSNAKIKRDLGWTPRFPTAREGVPDAVARLLADAD